MLGVSLALCILNHGAFLNQKEILIIRSIFRDKVVYTSLTFVKVVFMTSNHSCMLAVVFFYDTFPLDV